MDIPKREDIESAAELIYRTMPPTPQYCWPLLSTRCGTEIWVKHENHTMTGAFKVRGGIVHIDALARERSDIPGVIAATRGNHGQSVAFAARNAGIRSVVVVPHDNSREKNAAMRAFGAELVEHGRDFNEAYDYARERAEAEGLYPFPSYDLDLVRGVGTYSLEILSAVPDLDILYVPLGLGSGVCGAVAAREALGLKTNIVAAAAEQAPCYAHSFAAGKPVSTNSADTIADGLAVRIPDERPLEVILKGVARIVTVSEAEIEAAMRYYYTDTHNLAEGAGAAALAAALQERETLAGKRVGLILSGGNVDKEIYQRILGDAQVEAG